MIFPVSSIFSTVLFSDSICFGFSDFSFDLRPKSPNSSIGGKRLHESSLIISLFRFSAYMSRLVTRRGSSRMISSSLSWLAWSCWASILSSSSSSRSRSTPRAAISSSMTSSVSLRDCSASSSRSRSWWAARSNPSAYCIATWYACLLVLILVGGKRIT